MRFLITGALVSVVLADTTNGQLLLGESSTTVPEPTSDNETSLWTGSGYRWHTVRGFPLLLSPTDLVVAPLSYNSFRSMYVCRAMVEGDLHPGRYDYNDRSCHNSYGGKEHRRTDGYEVLIKTSPTAQFQWVEHDPGSKIPVGAIEAGIHHSGAKMYSAFVDSRNALGFTGPERTVRVTYRPQLVQNGHGRVFASPSSQSSIIGPHFHALGHYYPPGRRAYAAVEGNELHFTKYKILVLQSQPKEHHMVNDDEES